MDTIDFSELKVEVEKRTGFKCYEGQPGDQQVWYGISTYYSAFKDIVADKKLPTGSVVVLINQNPVEKHFYFRPTNTWY